MSSSDLAISVRGVSKSYTIAHNQERHNTLAEAALARLKSPFARPETETFWALKDVSFDVKKGEVVGIIGRNGAGKSTLLKILSRITEPTCGEIDLYGRIGSLLEVGTGFHPELTGRENVYLNGQILGMRKKEINRQFDAIVDFAGVERFIDTPVKRYSSGMYVRLAFAVAAHLEPEILIVDEVLAVGDAEFQRKCLGKMREVANGGRTVLFVSHNMAAVRALCTGGILLSNGAILADGTADDVAERYLGTEEQSSDGVIPQSADRSGTGELRCTAAKLMSPRGEPIRTATPGEPFDIVLHYIANSPVRGVTVSVDIDSREGYRITTLYSGFLNQTFSLPAGPGSLRCRVKSLPLRPDRYRTNIMLGHQYGQYDFVRNAFTLEIEPADVYGTGRLPEQAHGPALAAFEWTEN